MPLMPLTPLKPRMPLNAPNAPNPCTPSASNSNAPCIRLVRRDDSTLESSLHIHPQHPTKPHVLLRHPGPYCRSSTSAGKHPHPSPAASFHSHLRPTVCDRHRAGGGASTGYAAAYRGLRVERRASRQIFGAWRLRLALCDALQLRKASPLFLIPASEAGRSSGGDRQEAERKWVSTTYPRGSATYHALFYHGALGDDAYNSDALWMALVSALDQIATVICHLSLLMTGRRFGASL